MKNKPEKYLQNSVDGSFMHNSQNRGKQPNVTGEFMNKIHRARDPGTLLSNEGSVTDTEYGREDSYTHKILSLIFYSATKVCSITLKSHNLYALVYI